MTPRGGTPRWVRRGGGDVPVGVSQGAGGSREWCCGIPAPPELSAVPTDEDVEEHGGDQDSSGWISLRPASGSDVQHM